MHMDKRDNPRAVGNNAKQGKGAPLYKKPLFWIALVAVIAAVAEGIILATAPRTGDGVGSSSTAVSSSVPSAQSSAASSSVSSTAASSEQAGVVYHNTQYGFDLSLPDNWKGYTLVVGKWEGSSLEKDVSKVIATGPMISVRNPAWTAKDPHQDIPIMVFTLDQWNAVQNESMSVGAAPAPPSELGRNNKYVFALPARYNYTFPTGFEEVEKLLQGNPLKGFNI